MVQVLRHESGSDYPDGVCQHVADDSSYGGRNQGGLEQGVAFVEGLEFEGFVDGEVEGVEDGNGDDVGAIPCLTSRLPP